MKIKDITQLFRDELTASYSPEEIESFVFIALNEQLGLTRTEITRSGEKLLKVPDHEKLVTVISELKKHKPIQYILGHTEFYGCRLRVNEHVLIPRPETEELVDLIIKVTRNNGQQTTDNRQLAILDIGTGSGCIAIALKKNIENAVVSALDISEEALLLAKANALVNHARINFLQADILQAPVSGKPDPHTFDIIVSNPPYVLNSEKSKMNRNVVDYEPHAALFVNDSDPLVFYNTIAEFARHNLKKSGKLYFEINEALGTGVKKLLEEKGFKNTEVIRDMSGKDRIVSTQI